MPDAANDKSLKPSKIFKIIIIGDTGKSAFCFSEFEIGIGKSCLLKRLTTSKFNADHDVTVGVDFGSYMVKVEDVLFKL